MEFYPKKKMVILTTLVGLSLTGSMAIADQSHMMQLRFASFAVRDIPPSIEEAKAWFNEKKTMDQFLEEWLSSDEHRKKILRFFYDMIGTADFKLTTWNGRLKKNSHGVFYLKEKGDCGDTNHNRVEAWWMEAGQDVSMCNNAISDSIEFGTPNTDDHIVCTYPNSMYDDRCGCGPDQLICFPEEEDDLLQKYLFTAFRQRGLMAYEDGRSWAELFAGENFYGNRHMYYFYLYFGLIYPAATLPGDAEIAKLKSLPLDDWKEIPWPAQGPSRAPVVTNPYFMAQYNNFRSRIRALSESLLCQDVTGALNTDGISTFVNQDLGEFNLTHGTKPACASCHYPLDNMGSTILGWEDMGDFVPPFREPSQEGHVFGQTGHGPLFLMRGFVERGPGFYSCMAKRAWEILTGAQWSTLEASTQDSFENLAKDGPQALIRGMLTSNTLKEFR